MSDRLVVVANRLPVTARRSGGRWHSERSSGGLVAAMAPVLERTGGLWIGWPGDAPAGDAGDRAAFLARLEREERLASVELPAAVSRAFYEGYSNNTLWPLLHGFPSRVSFDLSSFHAYRDANARFADAVLERLRPDDLIWIHDYQLLLLAGRIRAARPEARIAFFLHVPFPPPEIFRILPQREELLLGLLGADVIAFQTHEHLGAFRRALLQVLGLESRMDGVEVDGRIVTLAARPIGIDPEPWEQLTTADPAVTRRIGEIRDLHHGHQLVIAVDRLDYSKGIPERLRAFRHLLVARPEWRGRVTLIQVAVPSRERVPRYAALRHEVNELVGEINGELGTAGWNPIVYLRRSVPKAELAALYAACDVGWVASLRDGMNLVAKEFVACHQDRAGVLLLSEFAGAAGEMGEAIRVNPYDETASAEALERALTMPADERTDRHSALLRRVRDNSAVTWAERSLEDLRVATAERGPQTGSLPGAPVDTIRLAFGRATQRACYLDYDGTLVPLAARPADAAPSPAVAEVIATLADQPRSTVVIVSGRPASDLDRWFGHIPGIWLAAEHGALLREPETREWRPLRPAADVAWKARVRPILEHFAGRAPGSLVEEKEYALAWHYRLVEPEFGPWAANELAGALDQQLAGTELAVLRGNKVVEVRFAWANKGEVAAHVRALGPDPDFELALGDDRTDEDLFERLPDDAFTIRVGPGSTRARYRLASPAAALALLATLSVDAPPPLVGSVR